MRAERLGVLERERHLREDRLDLPEGEELVLLAAQVDHAAKRQPVEQLHGEERPLRGGALAVERADLVDADDVGVRELLGLLEQLVELGALVGRLEQARGDQLEADLDVDLLVERPQHGAHRPLAHHGADFVAAGQHFADLDAGALQLRELALLQDSGLAAADIGVEPLAAVAADLASVRDVAAAAVTEQKVGSRASKT